MKPAYRIIFPVIIGTVLAAVIAWAQVHTSTMPQPAQRGVVGAAIGDNFEGLIGTDGKPLPPEKLAGKYQIVFFGFTHCPAICPTTLQNVTVMMKTLDPAQRSRIVPVFVSVDPERDSPAQLKTYLSMFDPTLVGLTGTPETLKPVLSHWKVYAAKVQTPEMSEYTVDHSAFIYFRAPDGTLLDIFAHEETPQNLAVAVKKALAAK